MDLKVSCKTFDENRWTYTLADRTEMTQEQWASQIKKHIKRHNHHQVFQECLEDAKSKRWYRNETDEDFAMQLYAEKYCRDIKDSAFMLSIVKDDMGYDQLSF